MSADRKVEDRGETARSPSLADEYPDFLVSKGEKPFITELYSVYSSDWKNGKGMFECAVREEVALVPSAYSHITDDVIAQMVRYFDRKYCRREIGRETPESTYLDICIIVEDNLFRLDKGLGMYADVDFGDVEEVIVNDSETVFQDTPSGSLEGKYATNVTDGHSVTKQTQGTQLNAVNSQMDKVRNLAREFVDLFDDCFLNTVAKV